MPRYLSYGERIATGESKLGSTPGFSGTTRSCSYELLYGLGVLSARVARLASSIP